MRLDALGISWYLCVHLKYPEILLAKSDSDLESIHRCWSELLHIAGKIIEVANGSMQHRAM